jgi:hypothetical protein
MNAGTNAHVPNPNPDKPDPKNPNREDRKGINLKSFAVCFLSLNF